MSRRGALRKAFCPCRRFLSCFPPLKQELPAPFFLSDVVCQFSFPPPLSQKNYYRLFADHPTDSPAMGFLVEFGPTKRLDSFPPPLFCFLPFAFVPGGHVLLRPCGPRTFPVNKVSEPKHAPRFPHLVFPLFYFSSTPVTPRSVFFPPVPLSPADSQFRARRLVRDGHLLILLGPSSCTPF